MQSHCRAGLQACLRIREHEPGLVRYSRACIGPKRLEPVTQAHIWHGLLQVCKVTAKQFFGCKLLALLGRYADPLPMSVQTRR